MHDLLLAKRGISLPATHGLRAATERHKARLTAEFTRSRIRRSLGTLAALTEHVEAGGDNTLGPPPPVHPRWVRVNALKTSLDEQLGSTFKGYEQVLSVEEVQKRTVKNLIFIDPHIPNLVAVPPTTDLTKSAAYASGALIFQDKASCFPAYLLDPLPEDGDVLDSCAAPGNKTTHLASIMASHSAEFDPDDPAAGVQGLKGHIHAFEKDKVRAGTLDKMTKLAGSDVMTTIHGGMDFLKADPNSAQFENVGALLLDPSCSGSGIVGRDEMPELHMPDKDAKGGAAIKRNDKVGGKNKNKKTNKEEADKAKAAEESKKRKRGDADEDVEVMLDDDGVPTAIASQKDLQARLEALAGFQLTLLEHAMRFPAARKITYSTCSIHEVENEGVVRAALVSKVAKERGWRVLKREDQVRGMKEWDVRGVGEGVVADACIRARRGDGRGTMGFFVCGFVRDGEEAVEKSVMRDEEGKIMRDAMGIPLLMEEEGGDVVNGNGNDAVMEDGDGEDDDWGGFGDEEAVGKDIPNDDPPATLDENESKEEASKPAKKKRRKAKKKT